MSNYYISWRAPGIGLFGVDVLFWSLLDVSSELILKKFLMRFNYWKKKFKNLKLNAYISKMF